MIFVTVGTHEQQFNRLVAEVDRLKKDQIIKDDVIIQTGYSDYIPVACEYKQMMGYDEMEKLFETADIVITHGGPGSIFGALKQFKVPIVVPRRSDLAEHVDMHQVEFTKYLQSKNNVLPVLNIEELEDKIVNYHKYIESHSRTTSNVDNLKNFINKLNSVVNRLFDNNQISKDNPPKH